MENEILQQILGELKNLNANQQETNIRLDKLETKVDNLESKVDTIDTKVTTIEKDVKYLKSASQGAFQDIENLEKRIEAIN